MYSRNMWLLLAFSLTQLILAKQITIQTEHGSITGFRHRTPKGTAVEVFLNIPYAKPPVGELRYEKPEPIEQWGERDGTKFGFDCIPHHVNATIAPSSEDCLTINVIRPTTTPPPEGFPVIFKVHGGGYELGSASLYGYKGFSELYVAQDVIVVTTQYRLGFLGFFSSGDDEIPGNLGLFDIAEALKFVHKNIKTFGGNKDKITVLGYSAGAAAAGQIGLSPISRDYVYTTIELSGSPFASWALGYRVPEASHELANKLGCAKNMKACLKTKSIAELHQAVLDTGFTRDDLAMIKWGPVIDGDFFPAPPSELLKQGRPVPSFLGISNKDAAFFVCLGKSLLIHKFYPGVENVSKFSKEILSQFIDKFILERDFGANHQKALEEIKHFFIGEEGENSKSRGYYLNAYTKFMNSLTFSAAAAEEMSQKNAADWPVYAYSFDHYNPVIFEEYDIPEEARGSVHISEYPYVFGVSFLGQDFMTEDDNIVKDLMSGLILSMAKTGKPSEYYAQVGTNNTYLSVTSTPQFKHAFYDDTWKFWKKINATYGYDLVALPLPSQVQNQGHEEL